MFKILFNTKDTKKKIRKNTKVKMKLADVSAASSVR